MERFVKISSLPACAGLLALLAGPAPATPASQPHADIQRTAVDFVRTHAERFAVPPVVTAGNLDSRLRLPRCERPLQAFEAPGGLNPGRTVVGVRCDGQRPWKLFVPVQIKLPAEVVVLSRPLRRGDLIRAADLGSRQVDLAELRGQFYRDGTELIGQRLKRHVAGDTVLTPAMIDADRLVQRGSRVTILSDTGNIEVRMAGKALSNGGRGDQIRVKNQASGRIITATVMGRGVVKVGP